MKEPDYSADRASAVEWARNLMGRDDWVILDSETTGLSIWSEVIQLAVINSRGHPLLNTLVKPTREIGADSTRIHGITNAEVENAPSFAEVFNWLADAIRGKTVVVYNAAFDRAMLLQSIHLSMGIDKPVLAGSEDWQCAMLQYAAYVGDWSDYHGNYRYQKLPGGDHSALGDALACLKLIQRMAGTCNASVVVPVMDTELEGYEAHYSRHARAGAHMEWDETPLEAALSAFVADLTSGYTDRAGSHERQRLAHTWLVQWRRDQGWRPIFEKQNPAE